MKNTEAISLSEVLKTTDESVSQKIAYFNLGRIYYDQHLYKESVEQYISALALEDDNNCRIWLGKNYIALGEKDRAKSVLNEVLNADNTNEEAKKLLGLIQ
jgi:FimV-like protein